MKPFSILFAIFALIAVHSQAPATGLVTFEREYQYRASDRDNMVSCRMIALEQVKLLLLEELGTYLESNTVVKSFSLTQDKITTLTANIVRTTIVDEKWDGTIYWLKARIVADPDDLTRKIDVLRKNRQKSEELGAAQKLYDGAHMALRLGKIDESEKLLKRVVAEYPVTDIAMTAKDQLTRFSQIRQFDIQQLDKLAQASLKQFARLLITYYADSGKMPVTLNDFKQSDYFLPPVGDPNRVLAAGVQILYLRQNKKQHDLRYALYAFHESGQKVYIQKSDEAKLLEMDKKSGIVNTLNKDYQVLETAGQITFLGER